MSLNRTLDRLFDEIRREAKRNSDFADRLDAVLRMHDSRRDVQEGVIADVAAEAAPPPGGGVRSRAKSGKAEAPPAPPVSIAAKPPSLNPAGLYKREGEDALVAALAKQDLSALRSLVAEHNLDPGGITGALTRDELAAHVVAQAKRRAERDEKMFDY
jgi:hypothetical protein